MGRQEGEEIPKRRSKMLYTSIYFLHDGCIYYVSQTFTNKKLKSQRTLKNTLKNAQFYLFMEN